MQEHKMAVKEYAQKGFKVTSIRSYHTQADEGLNMASNYTDDVWMTTPYVAPSARLIMGHCEVRHMGLGGGVENGMRIQALELFITKDGVHPSTNYDDMYRPDARDYVKQVDGKVVTKSEVERNLTGCAVATLFFPHVFTYDDFMDFKTKENLMMGMMPPKEEDYLKYIKKCCKEIEGGIQYAGAYTDVHSVEMLVQDTPGFEAGMREFNAELERELEKLGPQEGPEPDFE